MRVPTISGFAAMKTLAWTDRRAARDLFDLAGLAVAGGLMRAAAELFHQSTGRALAAHDFDGSVPQRLGSLAASPDTVLATRSGVPGSRQVGIRGVTWLGVTGATSSAPTGDCQPRRRTMFRATHLVRGSKSFEHGEVPHVGCHQPGVEDDGGRRNQVVSVVDPAVRPAMLTRK